MDKIYLKYCLLLLAIMLAPMLAAQVDLSETPHSKPSELLEEFMFNHPNESYVIQTDRDLYFSGTELWYSIWSLDDQTLIPFSYSGVVYVELMDKNGESMVQQTLKIDSNNASGRIILSDQLGSGTYYLRAYSNLQRNFGEHLFGIKLIQVINPSKPPEGTSNVSQRKPIVSIYPEGQSLLHGITNKLVVKATYPNGHNARISEGFLIRQADDTIAQLEFLVPGLGYCTFYADTSFSYHLDLPDIGRFPLEIQDKGFILTIQDEEKKLKLKVLRNGISKPEEYYLIGKARGQVFFEQALEDDLKEVDFPKSSLPDGLLQFSILSSGFEEYCQRLYYNDKIQKSLASELVFNKSSYNRGEIIDMEILLPEKREFELLSLTIRQDLFINQSLNNNFKSNVDLRPFLNDWDEFGQMISTIPADSLAGLMDIYLMTQNSSRYAWQDVLKTYPEKLEFIPEVYAKRLTGYGYSQANSMRIRNDHLALYFVSNEALMLKSRTDSEGRFSFEYPLHKIGMSEVVLQAFGNEEKMGISFDWPYHQSSYEYKLDYFHFDSSRFNEYDEAYVQSKLEKMYKEIVKPVQSNEEGIIPFYGLPDSRTYLEDYISMRNMEEVFKEIVPGEKIRILNDEYSLQLYHREKNNLLGDNPLILFNGAPVLNIKEMLDLPVSRVEYVDMVRQHYRIRNMEIDGIMNIVAKDLNLQLQIPSNAFKTTLDVFPLEYQFSMVQETRKATIPYLNPTLYWNPDLSFEGDSKRIAIMAGDNSGRYQVLLRGVDKEGETLELVKYILIK